MLCLIQNWHNRDKMLLCAFLCSYYVFCCVTIYVVGAFAKLRKAIINFVITLSVFLSVRPFAWNNSASTGRIFIKFDIWEFFFTNLLRKLKFYWTLIRTGILREDLHTLMIVFRLNLLRMRNISDKSCRESQNTHFMFNNFFSENRTFYEITWNNMVEPDRQ